MRRPAANVLLLLPQADEKIRAGSKIRQNLLKLLKMLDYCETVLPEAMVEEGQSRTVPPRVAGFRGIPLRGVQTILRDDPGAPREAGCHMALGFHRLTGYAAVGVWGMRSPLTLAIDGPALYSCRRAAIGSMPVARRAGR